MASNMSDQAWLESQEEESKPSTASGGHHKLKNSPSTKNIGTT